jgi:hypothetical protein
MNAAVKVVAVFLVATVGFAETEIDQEAVKIESSLLSRRDVVRELQLTHTQLLAMAESVEARRTQEDDALLKRITPDTPPEEIEQQTLEVQRGRLKTRKEAMTAKQLERLGQLRWQYESKGSLVQAIDRALSLTEEQAENCQDEESQLGAELHELMLEFHRRSQVELHQILTPEQRREWKKMTGEEFEFESQWTGLKPLSVLR